jgi:predicted MFS family arabinose efflux permease
MALLGIGIGSAFLLAVVLGPLIAAATSVRSLFWVAAGLAVVAALLLALLPQGIERPLRGSTGSIREAFKPQLLRLDLYIFILHALLTATFVALPFLLQSAVELPVAQHWEVYSAALVISLAGSVPLIVADDRRGKSSLVSIAVLLIFVGQLSLVFLGFAIVPVIAGLALFFAGFSFLEAGLPARLSVLADRESRGASLGVFSSSQFLGIFAGGLVGGRLLEGGRPTAVFVACAVISAIWLVAHRISAGGHYA